MGLLGYPVLFPRENKQVKTWLWLQKPWPAPSFQQPWVSSLWVGFFTAFRFGDRSRLGRRESPMTADSPADAAFSDVPCTQVITPGEEKLVNTSFCPWTFKIVGTGWGVSGGGGERASGFRAWHVRHKVNSLGNVAERVPVLRIRSWVV